MYATFLLSGEMMDITAYSEDAAQEPLSVRRRGFPEASSRTARSPVSQSTKEKWRPSAETVPEISSAVAHTCRITITFVSRCRAAASFPASCPTRAEASSAASGRTSATATAAAASAARRDTAPRERFASSTASSRPSNCDGHAIATAASEAQLARRAPRAISSRCWA